MYPAILGATWSQSVSYCRLDISIRSRRFNDIDQTGAINILIFLNHIEQTVKMYCSSKNEEFNHFTDDTVLFMDFPEYTLPHKRASYSSL